MVYKTNRQEDDLKCPVCIEAIQEGQVCIKTPCSHVFHSICVIGWFKIKSTCPMCKADMMAWRNNLEVEDVDELADFQ